jgi:hypothetical protein
MVLTIALRIPFIGSFRSATVVVVGRGFNVGVCLTVAGDGGEGA